MNLGFLKMIPEFMCSYPDGPQQIYCTPKTFCDYETESFRDKITAEINWNSPFTLKNMVTKFDIYCSNKLTYILFGGSFMFGHLIFLIFFSQMIDTKGRKDVIQYSLLVLIVSLGAMICVPGVNMFIYVMYGSLCVYGIASGILNLQGWIYLIEFMPKNYQAGAIIISNSGKGIALILGSLFFLDISKRQSFLLMFNLALAALVFSLISNFIPESPKYYYMMKKYRMARQVLVGIGKRYNGQQIKAIFREEAIDQNLEIDENYMDDTDISQQQLQGNSHLETENKIIKEGYGVFDRGNFIRTLQQDKVFRINAFGIIFCHAICSFSFSLFTFMLPSLKGNIYLNGFLIGSFEVLAYSFSGLMMKLLGLRYQIIICYLISFTSGLLYQILDFSESGELTGAVLLACLMFGVAANSNSTAYAAYVCCPQELTATFFVVQSFITSILVAFSPIIAEYDAQFVVIGFLLLTALCTIVSFYIKLKNI
eukprot:403330829